MGLELVGANLCSTVALQDWVCSRHLPKIEEWEEFAKISFGEVNGGTSFVLGGQLGHLYEELGKNQT